MDITIAHIPKKEQLNRFIPVLFFFSIAILALSSCVIKPPAVVVAKKQMPASFGNATSSDTISIAATPWKTFFNDKPLADLIEKALLYNPDLKIATQRIAISRTQVMTAKAALLPSVQAGVSFGLDRFGKYTMNGVGNFDTNLSPDISKDQQIPVSPYTEMFLGMRSSWEIDVWKKLSNRKKAAIAKQAAAQEEQKLLTTLLVSETAQLYYTLMALDYEMEVLKRNIALQQNELDIMQVQKDAGRATELAIKQFSAQLLHTKSLEYVIRQQLVVTENQLNFITGSYPGTIARSNNLMQTSLPVAVKAGVPANLLTQRPDIRAAEWTLQATGANIEAARAAYLPQLTITPYIGLSAFNPRLLFNPASIAAGALSGLMAPVFMQKQVTASYQIAMAENNIAYLEYEKIVLRSVREVVTDLKALENLQLSLDLKAKEVEELKRGVSVAGDLYNAGFATYLEIITAQRSVLEAELQQVSLKNSMLLAMVDLYRSLGGGWQ
jgi:outer membrane protein, multidrug efflux system